MFHPGCLALLFVFFVLILLPFFFAQLAVLALGRFGLSPLVALLSLIGIFLGSSVNIPFKQIAAGMASIGGAGTFDGIVLSGLMAAFLA